MLAGTIAGCDRALPPTDALAALNGEMVRYVDFESFLEDNSIATTVAQRSDVLSALLDQFLQERLLSRLAQDTLDLEDSISARQAVDALLSDGALAQVDEAMVSDFYRANLELYRLPERVHLRQFLVTERVTAERLRTLWEAAASYPRVLQQVEGDPAVHVGEEGEFTRKDLPAAIADTVFGLADGEISEVLTADYGFHLFQVVRHLPAGVAELEDVAPAIRARLEDLSRAAAIARLVDQARERYNVRVFERNVPFDYVGEFGTPAPAGAA